MALAKIRFVGGFLMGANTSEIGKKEMLKEDEVVEIKVKKQKRDFFGVLKGVGEFEERDRLEERE